MKVLNLTGILLSVFFFFGFTVIPKAKKNNYCAAALHASNQASGSVKLYRITYYDLNGSNQSTVVNLSSGQSAYLGFAAYANDISVLTKGGSFNTIVIEDQNGNIAYSQPYNGSNQYFFNNANLSCFYTWYIKLY